MYVTALNYRCHCIYIYKISRFTVNKSPEDSQQSADRAHDWIKNYKLLLYSEEPVLYLRARAPSEDWRMPGPR